MICKTLFALILGAALAAGEARSVEPGQTIADASIEAIDGRTLRLSEEAAGHRAVAIVFLSTTCPYSNFYKDRLPKMAATFAARGVAFVGVFPNRSETAEEVRAQARANSFAFPVARDGDLALTRLLGAVRTPEVFVLDRERKLRYRGQLTSKFGSQSLANALEDLLAGRKVRVPATKAFGCAIEGR